MMKNSNSKRTKQDKEQNKYHKITIGKVLFLIFSILLLLSLLTHNSQDDAVTEGGRNGHLFNWIGYFGAVLSGVIFRIFGIAGYFLGFFCFISASKSLFREGPIKKRSLTLSIILFIFGLSILFALWPETLSPLAKNMGINTLSGGGFRSVLSISPR